MSDDNLKALVAEARASLEGLPEGPWKVNSITNPNQDPQIATLRAADGFPVLGVHPESQSMMVGKPATFAFVEKSADLVRRLADALESCDSGEKSTE